MKNTLKTLAVIVDVGTIALCAWSIYKTLSRPVQPAGTWVHVPHEGPSTDVNAAPAV